MYILIAYPNNNTEIKERGIAKLELAKELCVGKVETLVMSANTYNLMSVRNHVDLSSLTDNMSSDTLFSHIRSGITTYVLGSECTDISSSVVLEVCESLAKSKRNSSLLGLLELDTKVLSSTTEREQVAIWLDKAVSSIVKRRANVAYKLNRKSTAQTQG